MAVFDLAVRYVLKQEGGLVENEDGIDQGGITNFGISFNFLSSISKNTSVIKDDVRNITEKEAIDLYREHFWLDSYAAIVNQDVANYIFDMSVNLGHAQTAKLVQRATWAMTGDRVLRDDGIFGAMTIKEVNWLVKDILPALRAERAGFYRLLAAKEPFQAKFLDGWLNRTYL